MPHSTSFQPEPDHEPPLPESELLISRMVDREATSDDRARFELMAGGDPSLWRRLAMKQSEMSQLTDAFERETRCADHIELPTTDTFATRRKTPRWLTVVACSGWAAMVMLSATWWMFSMTQDDDRSRVTPVITNAPLPLSYDDHLSEYLKAPFVVGEMAPTMLHREVMSDGRTAIRFLRRIEEVLFLPAGQEPPTDQDGAFTSDPSRLRGKDDYQQQAN